MEGGCHSVRAVSHDKRKRLSDISSNYRASANYSPFFTPRTIADRPIGSFPSAGGKQAWISPLPLFRRAQAVGDN